MAKLTESNSREHMANERTFLAWIRTSIGVIVFGFVIEKFALFMKQMSLIVGKATISNAASSNGYSGMVGIFLIGFGTLMSIFAFIKFRRSGKQIDQDTYRPSGALDLLLVTVVFTVGIFLVIYLIKNQ